MPQQLSSGGRQEAGDGNASIVALVLGAHGGIGGELCRLLEASGCRVAIAVRDPESDRRDELLCRGGRVELEATDMGSIDRAFRKTLERCGRLDGVANCVGSLLLKPAHLTTPDEWRATIATNLGSSFGVVRAAGRHMRAGGSVILMSSAAARIGLPNHEAIAAAQAGVIGLVSSAAATYAARGLRFNAVAPGLVRTPMTAQIVRNEAIARASTALHALGRLGEAADVARLIAWLLDPRQSWVTGQVFGVDGGLATVRART